MFIEMFLLKRFIFVPNIILTKWIDVQFLVTFMPKQVINENNGKSLFMLISIGVLNFGKITMRKVFAEFSPPNFRKCWRNYFHRSFSLNFSVQMSGKWCIYHSYYIRRHELLIPTFKVQCFKRDCRRSGKVLSERCLCLSFGRSKSKCCILFLSCVLLWSKKWDWKHHEKLLS